MKCAHKGSNIYTRMPSRATASSGTLLPGWASWRAQQATTMSCIKTLRKTVQPRMTKRVQAMPRVHWVTQKRERWWWVSANWRRGQQQCRVRQRDCARRQRAQQQCHLRQCVPSNVTIGQTTVRLGQQRQHDKGNGTSTTKTKSPAQCLRHCRWDEGKDDSATWCGHSGRVGKASNMMISWSSSSSTSLKAFFFVRMDKAKKQNLEVFSARTIKIVRALRIADQWINQPAPMEIDLNFAIMGGVQVSWRRKIGPVCCSSVRFLEVRNIEFPAGTENVSRQNKKMWRERMGQSH